MTKAARERLAAIQLRVAEAAPGDRPRVLREEIEKLPVGEREFAAGYGSLGILSASAAKGDPVSEELKEIEERVTELESTRKTAKIVLSVLGLFGLAITGLLAAAWTRAAKAKDDAESAVEKIAQAQTYAQEAIKKSTEAATKRVEQLALTPVGTVVAWPGDVTTVPSGWALCDGADWPSDANEVELSRILGQRYGSRKLPDYRGAFLRGAANNRPVFDVPASGAQKGVRIDFSAAQVERYDAGGQLSTDVGSIQADQLQDHEHRLAGLTRIAIPNPGGAEALVFQAGRYFDTDGSAGRPAGGRFGLETRPVNITVNWIIRVK